MSVKYVKVFRLCDGAVTLPWHFVYFAISSKIRIFETINKTWHAVCSKLAVSKILDWLVK